MKDNKETLNIKLIIIVTIIFLVAITCKTVVIIEERNLLNRFLMSITNHNDDDYNNMEENLHKVKNLLDNIMKEKSGNSLIIEYGDTFATKGYSIEKGDALAINDDGLISAIALGTATLKNEFNEIIEITVVPAEVDVILFTGQSNMVGAGGKHLVYIEAGQAYEFKYNDGDGKLIALQDPVGENLKDADASVGSSIVPEFVSQYVRKSGRKVVAIHVAKRGIPISDFVEGGGIYGSIIQKYGSALDFLENNENFTVGKKFYLMFQGEYDTNITSIDEYKTIYLDFHNSINENFNFEFGGLFYNGRNVIYDKKGVVRINRAKYQLAKEEEDIILVSTIAGDALKKHPEYLYRDNVHFNIVGLKALARESCTNVLNYLGYGDSDKEGLDPVTYIVSGEPGT